MYNPFRLLMHDFNANPILADLQVRSIARYDVYKYVYAINSSQSDIIELGLCAIAYETRLSNTVSIYREI
jgi:hypothetical protein